MPTTEYEEDLDERGSEWIRLRIQTSGGRVTAFTDQYETILEGRRVPVTRYDSAHGRPHQDVLDRQGFLIQKRWLDGHTLDEALTEGVRDLRANWRRYRTRFLGE